MSSESNCLNDQYRGFFENSLSKTDPELHKAISDELKRQQEHIELIASENIVSQAVLEAQGSVLTNKYAEGYSGKRYYNGCEHVDVAENLANERLKKISAISNSAKTINAAITFVDIAGLVKGASDGEGLGNKFFGNIREVDAIAHVLRCFEGDTTHVLESVDPIRDLEIINLELAISDLQILEKRILKLDKN